MSNSYDPRGAHFTHRARQRACGGVPRASFAVRLALWTTLCGLAGGCGLEREGSAGWSIQFACSNQAARADAVSVAISKGRCPASDRPVYQTEVLGGGGASLAIPEGLGAGPYAFHANATDGRGTLVAQACMSVTLPRTQPVKLVLLGDGVCQPAGSKSDWPVGQPSSSSDASVDLGDPGAGGDQRDDAGVNTDHGGVSGPRLEVARDTFLQGEPIPVGYADVDKAAGPFVGLYREGVVEATARFEVPFGPKETVASGSHTFNSPAAGRYTVRLMYDNVQVVHGVTLTVMEDRDRDGTPDASDGCPEDPAKLEPAACGCGRADTDADGDQVLDCLDGCPMDAAKREPLACGCGVADGDTDGDGALDCHDGCVMDPNKTSVGACGCGKLETDADSDGTPDCVDACPADPKKGVPGVCGCGVTEPVDVASFRDARNFACTAWKGYNCRKAVEKYRYTEEQEASLLANCPKSCVVCP